MDALEMFEMWVTYSVLAGLSLLGAFMIDRPQKVESRRLLALAFAIGFALSAAVAIVTSERLTAVNQRLVALLFGGSLLSLAMYFFFRAKTKGEPELPTPTPNHVAEPAPAVTPPAGQESRRP